MHEEYFDPREIVFALKRNFASFCFIVVTCATVGVVLAFILPKQFKSKSTLNIQSSYFQSPMVSDLISEVHDPSELKAQRESLLRLALDDTFIDSIAEKHEIYRTSAESKQRLLERELFRDKIEYFSLSPTTFQINTIGGSPEIAHDINSAVLNRMKDTLIEQRIKNLLNTRNAIQGHVQSLGLALRDITSPGSSEQPDVLRGELERLEANIAVLGLKYTEKHPDMIKLQTRADSLRQMLDSLPVSSLSDPGAPTYLGPLSKAPTQDVYNELLKKLSYLNVVIDMEQDRSNISYLGVIEQPSVPAGAFFPSKKIFGLLGLLVGVLAGAALVIVRELRYGVAYTPAAVSESLGVPYFGELPSLAPVDYARAGYLSSTRTPGKTRRLSMPANWS